MKQFIKKMLPSSLLLLVKTIYAKLFINQLKTDTAREQFESLDVLKFTISFNKYGGYCVPESSKHRPACQKILANDIYEPNTIDFLRSNCAEGDIVHAGTFFGDFLPALSKGCNQFAKIWAFEPNPENYRCAAITLLINNLINIELFNAGLGAKKERLLIKTSDEDGRSLGGASRIIGKTKPHSSYKTESVQIVTIDDTIEKNRNVSIIQLDVEGYEKEALIGGIKTIKRCLPIILLEVWPESNLLKSKWFSDNILSLGYKLTDIFDENSVFVCDSKN